MSAPVNSPNQAETAAGRVFPTFGHSPHPPAMSRPAQPPLGRVTLPTAPPRYLVTATSRSALDSLYKRIPDVNGNAAWRSPVPVPRALLARNPPSRQSVRSATRSAPSHCPESPPARHISISNRPIFRRNVPSTGRNAHELAPPRPYSLPMLLTLLPCCSLCSIVPHASILFSASFPASPTPIPARITPTNQPPPEAPGTAPPHPALEGD